MDRRRSEPCFSAEITGDDNPRKESRQCRTTTDISARGDGRRDQSFSDFDNYYLSFKNVQGS
jgi:hypothetical protein